MQQQVDRESDTVMAEEESLDQIIDKYAGEDEEQVEAAEADTDD